MPKPYNPVGHSRQNINIKTSPHPQIQTTRKQNQKVP
ncbi:uncharacterized protein G2W53_010101 [Senna tora]|uniref:Uncharacterized protein n=1 Tax=Senna tora TaxID=362788 RepID=A0A834X0B6_9FABA|nr:uncharacterized protein G2W53_010101 [Senna tora]